MIDGESKTREQSHDQSCRGTGPEDNRHISVRWGMRSTAWTHLMELPEPVEKPPSLGDQVVEEPVLNDPHHLGGLLA
jgi:hypothetical protein